MASPPRTREEERRLNARTLAIASAASASAAAVTSQLWIAGTWIAAAVTPLIVALVSELLHRPSERLARAITSDRPALRLDDADEAPAARTHLDPDAPAPAPVRVYRQPTARPASRRRIAVRVIALTALLGLVIGGAALTAAELIAGQSIGKGDGRTSLGGGKARDGTSSQERAPAQTVTTEEPAVTEPTETRTVTVPAPTETTTAPPSTTPTTQETAP